MFCTPLAAQDQIRPGDPVVIVGGGNSAGQVATWLADHGHPVTVVIRGQDLSASMSQYLIDRIARHPAITIMSRCAVREVDGAGRLERVTVEDLTTSTRRTLAAAALFVLIGAEAHTQWLPAPPGATSHHHRKCWSEHLSGPSPQVAAEAQRVRHQPIPRRLPP